MDGNVHTALAEVDLHMVHDAMAALYGRGVVEYVPQHDSISGPEVGLQLRVGHDMKGRENSI
jgi:hypothetical protein